MFADNRVRIHIKDLAVVVLVNVPDPGDEEWEVLQPWLNSELTAFSNGRRNRDKFATLVWQHFFGSTSWFSFADRRGLIAGWLASDREGLVNMAVNYLRFHQRLFGDKVAELLEPYVGKRGDWPQRLRYLMEWADHGNSRRFFDLFLRLIDNGTLDDARGPIAVNSTFWSMFYGLAKARPAWVPEVIAHWLRRRFAVIRQQPTAEGGKPNWHDLFNHDDFGAKYFHEAATKAPAAFVQNVLPAVMEITDAAVYDGEGSPPKRDAVWPLLFHSQHDSADSACRNALVAALEALAKDDPEKLDDNVAELRGRETYIANFLLLSLFTAGAAHFADRAVDLLCDQSWRFHCGFSDSPYWVAKQLVRAVVPLCSRESRAKLEKAILSYSPHYERTPEGHTLAGIRPEHRTTGAQARYEELERKFGKPDGPPSGIHAYSVGSPIEKRAAEKMSDGQWLSAIAKYPSEERPHHWDNPEKGGAWQLAGMLREFVRSEPERFARLSLRFPADANPAYIERTLDGLKGSAVSTELKLAVCRKAYVESRVACGQAIADLLGNIEEPLPDDAVQVLDWLAAEHPDPDKELWSVDATAGKPYYGGDILTHGINTTRGRAAEAIRDLILIDAGYIARFRTTLDRLVSDKSISVRSCVASTLLAVARHDTPLALELFTKLVAADDQLLATPYVDRFIYHHLRQYFAQLRPYVERILRSREPKVSEAGARLASLAALYHEDAADLAKEAMSGNASQRLGVAQVASSN
ncbi:MAG: hypothetical protein ACTS5I_07105, partial [Rhodanobacter sp.]